jgi:hypothetical protein
MGRPNRSVHLVNYPVGMPNVETDFRVVTTEIPDTIEDVRFSIRQVVFGILLLINSLCRGKFSSRLCISLSTRKFSLK